MKSISELDIEDPEQLIGYLQRTGRLTGDKSPAIRILEGGVSNRTVLVELPDGEAWVMKQALDKLRVSVDWFSDPVRIRREALGMKWLAELAPAGTITPLIFEDPEHNLMAMLAVPQPHDNWKSLLMQGNVREDHVAQFAILLASVHRAAYEQRAHLSTLFDDLSFFTSLRLEPYYEYTASQEPRAADFLHELIRETLNNRVTLVHGDYSPKNILVHNDQLILLDHEVIHFGDPAFDVGFALTHFLSKAHHFPEYRPDFAAAADQFWLMYREGIGDVTWALEMEERVARHTFACLLARVSGRSRLEYLSDQERSRQSAAVLSMLPQMPVRVQDVIQQFVARLNENVHD